MKKSQTTKMMRTKQLVAQFRKAMDEACENGNFADDMSFHGFPRGCCGDASDLLAKYLSENEIKTRYVCGIHYRDIGEEYYDSQSHAWLVDEDDNIIDITGDQFKNDPEYGCYDLAVYYGEMDSFHELFEVENRDIREPYDIRKDERLSGLYREIKGFLK